MPAEVPMVGFECGEPAQYRIGNVGFSCVEREFRSNNGVFSDIYGSSCEWFAVGSGEWVDENDSQQVPLQ